MWDSGVTLHPSPQVVWTTWHRCWQHSPSGTATMNCCHHFSKPLVLWLRLNPPWLVHPTVFSSNLNPLSPSLSPPSLPHTVSLPPPIPTPPPVSALQSRFQTGHTLFHSNTSHPQACHSWCGQHTPNARGKPLSHCHGNQTNWEGLAAARPHISTSA